MEISKEYHRIKEVGEEKPKGGKLSSYGGIDEIKALLQGQNGVGGVDPKAVEDAGIAYVDAGGVLAESYIDLENLAVELAKHWKGKDAVEPQKALQLLHATTRELANRANHIGRPLEWFGRDILPWYKENAVGHGAVSFDDDISLLPFVDADWNTHPHTRKAREHLDALNARMGELYDLLPEGVEKRLPKIDAAGFIPFDEKPSPVSMPSPRDLSKEIAQAGFDGLSGNRDFTGTDLTAGGPSAGESLTGGGPSVGSDLPDYRGGPDDTGDHGANPGSQTPPGIGDAGFPGTDVPGQNGAGIGGPDMGKGPDGSVLDGLDRSTGSNMDDQGSTTLASYQPPGGYQSPGNYQFPATGGPDFESARTPNGNGAAGSPLITNMGSGGGGSSASAGGAASAGNASAVRANGAANGMPFFPGAGPMGGGGENDESIAPSSRVTEDDDVWGSGEGYINVDHQGRFA